MSCTAPLDQSAQLFWGPYTLVSLHTAVLSCQSAKKDFVGAAYVSPDPISTRTIERAEQMHFPPPSNHSHNVMLPKDASVPDTSQVKNHQHRKAELGTTQPPSQPHRKSCPQRLPSASAAAAQHTNTCPVHPRFCLAAIRPDGPLHVGF